MPIDENSLKIFCDGASSGNPGPAGWGAIVVTPEGKVLELGGAKFSATNNEMELTAAIEALEQVRDWTKEIDIFTDSTYVIRGITQWIWGWRKHGWKTAEGTDVANQELWRRLSGLVVQKKIKWRYVPGHSGIPGNERVDEIAVNFAKGRRPKLYQGSLLKYDIAIHDLPENTELPPLKPKKEKVAAYSYLSVVGGIPMRHSSWPECEKRVKGRSGAKFKKTTDAEDEARILAEWGMSLP